MNAWFRLRGWDPVSLAREFLPDVPDAAWARRSEAVLSSRLTYRGLDIDQDRIAANLAFLPWFTGEAADIEGRPRIQADTVKRGGKISQDEFMMLSQGARQALANYLPGDAPGLANPAKADAAKTRIDLDAEQARLKASIDYVSTSLRGLSENITRGMAPNGPLDPLSGALPTRPLPDAAKTRGDSPVINLNVSSVAVQVQLADQLGSLLNNYVDGVVSREVKAMETRLRQQPIPNPQGSVE